MRLVVGADILLEGRRWHGLDRIRELAPLLVLGRVGLGQVPGAPLPVLPEVSSSGIRDAIRAGRASDIETLVPRSVLAYIEAHGLYRAS
jgi:nicotinic acid mononucleotide adenylyltransferase